MEPIETGDEIQGQERGRKLMRLVRGLSWALSILLVMAAVFVTAWWYLGLQGSTRIEQWIGRNVLTVIENYINPKVQFGALDYQAPGTVVLEDLALIVEHTPILEAQRVVLDLAEVPQKGKPIKIRQIDLEGLDLQITQNEEGEILGWGDFVKPEVLSRELQSIPRGQRFSDMLRLRQVNIRDGQIRYDDTADDYEPMVLPGVNLTLSATPAEDQPGVYQLAGRCLREPLANVEWDSHINLDTGVWDIQSALLRADINDGQYSSLPPQLQEVLRRYEVGGHLTALWQGEIPLLNLSGTSGELQLTLEQGHLAYGGLRCPVDVLEANLTLPGNRLQISADQLELTSDDDFSLVVEQADLDWTPTGMYFVSGEGIVDLTVGEVAIGQTLWPIKSAQIDLRTEADELRADYTIDSCDGVANGDVVLLGGSELRVNWSISDLKLEKTLERVQRKKATYAGMVSSQGSFNAKVNQIAESIDGQGQVTIDQGKLVNIPVIREIVSVASKVANRKEWPSQDKAHVDFQLVPKHLNVKSLEMISPFINVKGDGEIHYSGKLDLKTKVVVFSAITRRMGRLGDWLEQLADDIVTYNVGGTWSNPKVQLNPLGVLPKSEK